MVSPRLALLSPVRGCGKTLLLDIASRLVASGRMAGSITAAAIYHIVDEDHPTLLLDEADNLDTAADKLLKSILNNGWRLGGRRESIGPARGRAASISTRPWRSRRSAPCRCR
jgi:hypothetical protein